MFTAYNAGRFSTFTSKLEPLSDYLAALKPQPRRRQSPSEMIAALRAIKARVTN